MCDVEQTHERRVLIVDDNRAIHEDFRKILSDDGSSSNFGGLETSLFSDDHSVSPSPSYCIDNAYQGNEALEKVATSLGDQQPYEVAFVDMRMPPGWDGAKTIERIWQEDSDVQVVICTAYSDHSWSDLFQRFGGTDNLLILKKPFDSSEVRQLAATLTEKWRLNRKARLRMTQLQQMVGQKTAELTAEIAERKRIEQELRWMSEHDPLTGLFNRRAFHERFYQEWQRAIRYGRPLSFGIIDLDFFKKVNDTHGHAAGDAVLEAVARLLKEQCRPSDIVCRHGGEEFCVVLPETDKEGAVSWGERFRLAIANTATTVDNAVLKVSASVGVAERLSDTTSMEHLEKLADQALAVAKQSGRNQVVPSSSLTSRCDSQETAAASAASLPATETILLAEDEAIVRKLAVRLLEDAGYHVLTAEDGEEALRVYDEHRDEVALLILDAVMPKLDGREVYRRIIAQDPHARIIFCSGYDPETAQSGLLTQQNLRLVQKPFDRVCLLQTIREALDEEEPQCSLPAMAW